MLAVTLHLIFNPCLSRIYNSRRYQKLWYFIPSIQKLNLSRVLKYQSIWLVLMRSLYFSSWHHDLYTARNLSYKGGHLIGHKKTATSCDLLRRSSCLPLLIIYSDSQVVHRNWSDRHYMDKIKKKCLYTQKVYTTYLK